MGHMRHVEQRSAKHLPRPHSIVSISKVVNSNVERKRYGDGAVALETQISG